MTDLHAARAATRSTAPREVMPRGLFTLSTPHTAGLASLGLDPWFQSPRPDSDPF
ncbi:MAG: hypothetical protein U0794_16525 [Isosphaeraceae bacterium]